MLKPAFDAVMERRSRRLIAQIRPLLPASGPILDLGSGTGHFAALLERELGLDVVTADVADIHVVGPAPVVIGDGALPFEKDTFSAALLLFMLHYTTEPARLLAEVARVTRGPVILVQSLHGNRLGYARLRVREFVWTTVAFNVSKLVGYVAPDAPFSMRARRFYSARTLRRDVAAAGLRVGARRERALRPGSALVVAGWALERNG
jgi:SAM-dependent methyltransferase